MTGDQDHRPYPGSFAPIDLPDLRGGPSPPGEASEISVDWRSAGEAERILKEVKDAEEQLYWDVHVPKGMFQYAPPVERQISFKERRPEEWFNTELPPMNAAFGFLEKAHGRLYLDELIEIAKKLGNLLYAPNRQADGMRTELFETSFARWAQISGVTDTVAELRAVYEAKDDGLLRSDVHHDPFGTDASLAYCDGKPFVLMVRSRMGKKPDGGAVITRLIEAVRVESEETVMRTANELSLRERLRVKHLLDTWGASEEQALRVNRSANRRLVRSDTDIRRLYETSQQEERRQQQGEAHRHVPLRMRVARALMAVANSLAAARPEGQAEEEVSPPGWSGKGRQTPRR
ncbi:MAG TPA: hypothetical protein VIS56_01755 [Candidatus Saccharimonadales bacterium]